MKKRRDASEVSDTPVKLKFRYPEILVINPKFRRGVMRLREEWQIPERGFHDIREYDIWYEDLNGDGDKKSRYGDFMNEIDSLRLTLKKYPRHWNMFMYAYITREDIFKEYKLRSGNYPYKPSFVQEGDLITIRMYTNSTRKDLAPILSQIYEKQKLSDDYDNSRERKKLPRDIKIIRKYLETHSIEEVIGDSTLTEGERESLDNDFERVRAAIRRLLKRIFPDQIGVNA